MPTPAIIAEIVTSISAYNRPINAKDPTQDTVAYKGLENTTGCSLQSTSRNIPPIVPVMTPMKLAIKAGAPAISETNVPAIPKVASPAASATKKYLGKIFTNLATKNMNIALPIEAIKNV